MKFYVKAAACGYYSVYLDDFRVEAEMTATYWTGIYRSLIRLIIPAAFAATARA